MDTILHCGVHRTNSSGLQSFLCRHKEALLEQNIDVCTMQETRKGLFAGVMPCATALEVKEQLSVASDRVAKRMAVATGRGAHKLFVSDTHLLGSLQDVVRAGQLYPDAGAHLSKFVAPFGGCVQEVIVTIRSCETFWISALAAAVATGEAVPDRARLQSIAFNRRSWREVITEVARALPDVTIRIVPYEHYNGRPEQILMRSLDCDLAFEPQQPRQNRAPQLPELRRLLAERGDSAADLPFGMGPWNPFCAEELAAMRELYADDLMWLIAGADGLAKMTETPSGTRAVTRPPSGYQGKGQSNGREERQMARPR